VFVKNKKHEAVYIGYIVYEAGMMKNKFEVYSKHWMPTFYHTIKTLTLKNVDKNISIP